MGTVLVSVPLSLPGVFPQELTVVPAGGAIGFQFESGDFDDTFKGMELGADHESFVISRPLIPPAEDFGIVHARCKTHTDEKPACAVHAEGVYQLLAHPSLRIGMNQEHAVFVQPYLTSFGTEMY